MVIQNGMQQPTLDGHSLLNRLNHIVIREKIQMMQVLLGWEKPNVYQIEDKFGAQGHVQSIYLFS